MMSKASVPSASLSPSPMSKVELRLVEGWETILICNYTAITRTPNESILLRRDVNKIIRHPWGELTLKFKMLEYENLKLAVTTVGFLREVLFENYYRGLKRVDKKHLLTTLRVICLYWKVPNCIYCKIKLFS